MQLKTTRMYQQLCYNKQKTIDIVLTLIHLYDQLEEKSDCLKYGFMYIWST